MLLFSALLACLPQTVEADFYNVDYLTPPMGEVLEVGGMAFLSDGTLLVSTRRGRVWWIDNALAEDPSEAKFHIFAEGLHEGLGLQVRDDRIYLVQRSELSELIDTDGDKVCDRVETISQGWGMSGNYHEFAFGLPMDSDGNFYVGTNVGFWNPEWWHGLSKVRHRGWILRISPEGEVTPYASGARGPAGFGTDLKGNIFYTDNQGDWLPACGMFHVQGGEFFSHPASLRWTDHYKNGDEVPSSLISPGVQRTPPALWIPYEWSRSTGNMVTDATGGKFGPFEGQFFVAELTNGLVFRALLEEVQGQMQGAVVLFRQQVGSAFRVQFGPDGTLFAGMTNRGWGGLAPGSGIARIRWNGETPLEYKTIHLVQDGFELGFTSPLAEAPEAASVAVRDYDYNWWWDYGSPQMRQQELEVSEVVLSDDRLSLRIVIPKIRAARNIRVNIPGVGILHPEFDYTINQLPEGPLTTEHIAKEVEPPEERESEDAGWLTMTWADPFDAWESEGWKLVAAIIDPEDPTRFSESPGNSALVNTGENLQEFRSHASFGDIAFRFNFMLPKNGDSGLYFMDRYELQLCDDPTACCGIIGSKGPRVHGYRGHGQWHKVEGRFYAPRFDKNGNKTANARFEGITVDGVMVIGSTECNGTTGGAVANDEVPLGPLRFQSSAGLVALGDVRVKVLSEGEPLADSVTWTDLDSIEGTTGDFELRGRLSISDGGSASLEFCKTAEQEGWTLMLDHSGPGQLRTGSIVGQSPITTQFLQPGIPFDLRLRSRAQEQGTHIQVWLNQVLVNDFVTTSGPQAGSFLLNASITPKTKLDIESLQVRSL